MERSGYPALPPLVSQKLETSRHASRARDEAGVRGPAVRFGLINPSDLIIMVRKGCFSHDRV